MKNFKSSESRDGGRDRRGGDSFGKRDNFRGNSFSKPSFGGKSFNKGGDFKKKSFGSDRGEVVMSKATCSECSNVCEVPFKPNGERPVFCSNCFMSKRDGTFNNDRDERKGNVRELSRRDGRDEKTTYSAPTSNNNAEVAEMKKQITNLNTKIDSLANAFDKFISEKASTVPTAKKVEEAKVVVAAKKVTAKKVVTKEVVAKVAAVKASVKAPAKKEAVTKVVTKKVAPAVVKKVIAAKKVATKTVATKKSVVAKKK